MLASQANETADAEQITGYLKKVGENFKASAAGWAQIGSARVANDPLSNLYGRWRCLRQTWRKRWFVLTDESLSYYKTSEVWQRRWRWLVKGPPTPAAHLSNVLPGSAVAGNRTRSQSM